MGHRKKFGICWKGKILDGCMGSVVRPKSIGVSFSLEAFWKVARWGEAKVKIKNQECEDILVRSLFRGYVFGKLPGV